MQCSATAFLDVTTSGELGLPAKFQIDTTTATLNIDGINFYMDAVKCCLMSAVFLEVLESDNR